MEAEGIVGGKGYIWEARVRREREVDPRCMTAPVVAGE